MSKISIDIDYIVENLKDIGYEISDRIIKENNGTYWQLKFSNSGAIVTIYDSNRTENTVVNGKLEDGEKEKLTYIVNGLKSKELKIKPINKIIVELIRSKKEEYYYDFKQIPHKENEKLLHDILCLSNNTENKDAFLILGVSDDYNVIGVDEEWNSNNIYDFLNSILFAGGHIPEVKIEDIYYKYKRVVVIQCVASPNVPFYLEKNYNKIGAYQIYTRVGDTNTPIDKHASYKDTEKLWRIHFENKEER